MTNRSLCIAGNSGGGLYSKEYVSLQAIMAHGDVPITGKTLRPLFKGKSANTPGFAWAAARDMGLILARPGEEGGYQRGDAQRCREEVAALITAGTAIPVVAPLNFFPAAPWLQVGEYPWLEFTHL